MGYDRNDCWMTCGEHDDAVEKTGGDPFGIKAAVAAERERCAKIAEDFYLNNIGQITLHKTIQQAIADAIRKQ
jgi:hypothetical protein